MPTAESIHPEGVTVYSAGICFASVCAPVGMTLAEIERLANLQVPTGVGPWRKSHDEAFANGSPNPCPCEMTSSRVHYLLSC